MKLIVWSNYLEKLEKIASRNTMTEVLVELVRELKGDGIEKAIYLMLGRLGPLYDNPEFALAEKQVIKAIALAFDQETEAVTKLYKRKGDLGEVAFRYKVKGERLEVKGLEVTDLYDELLKIAKDGGQGSQERKIEGLANLIKKTDTISAKFIVRIVMSKLRLGFSDKTIIDALSVMEKGDKSAKANLELAYSLRPDVGWLVKTVKEKGVSEAVKQKAEVGIPISPMLCQRLKTAKEMINKMNIVAIEPKFDGTRVLVHFDRNGKEWQIKTFTRNLEETSWMFPELKEIGKHVKANKLILDCEAIGYDPKTKKLVNFQTTITRKRKHGIAAQASQVPIRFYIFDVIYKDGESLLDNTYEERRKILKETILGKDLLVVDDYWVTDDPKMILQKHKELIAQGLEGVIVKKIDSQYVPGRTAWRWVKMKEAEDSAAKLSDTLDLVVMGFNAGKGKRTSFGLGAFLVGVKDGNKILTISKIGTGLTDEQFKELKHRLDKIVTNKKPVEYEVDKNLYPDVWVEPKVVVEIAADEITKSPTHSAGVALRFPRLVRFRDDKNTEQITTLQEVKEIC